MKSNFAIWITGMILVTGMIFFGCTSVESAGNSPTDFVIEDGVLVKYNGRSRNVIIPEGVIKIGKEVFEEKKLTSLTLPNSLTEIGYRAFSSNNLKSLVIPEGVTRIGKDAFHDNRLTSLTLPNSLTEIGDGAFSFNNLKSLIIPEGVTRIEKEAFYWNSKLTSLTLPDSLTVIGDSAFIDNKSLRSVTIPSGVKYLGSYAFKTPGFIGEAISSVNNVTINGTSLFIGNIAFGSKFRLDLYYRANNNQSGTYSWKNNKCYFNEKLIPLDVVLAYEKEEERKVSVAKPYYDRGREYIQSGDLDRAIANFTEAIRLDPNFSDAYRVRGEIYYNHKQDYDRAIADYTQGIRVTPLMSPLYFRGRGIGFLGNLYFLYVQRGNAYMGKHIGIWKTSEALASKEAREAGELDLAMADFNEAIKLDNTIISAYMARGTMYTAKGDYDRAIADYEKAIELDPQNATAIDTLPGLYGMRLGLFD